MDEPYKHEAAGKSQSLKAPGYVLPDTNVQSRDFDGEESGPASGWSGGGVTANEETGKLQ